MVERELIQIIKTVLTQKRGEPVAVEDWGALVRAAAARGVLQDLAYYAASAPEGGRPDEKTAAFLKNELFKAAAASANQLYAAEEMQRAFEENGVRSLMFKGVRTKKRYPDEVLRSMGDIDILYREEQHKKFRSLMENTLHYGGYTEGRKHDAYTRPPFVHVEAHRELVGTESEFSGYCKGCWERAEKKPNCRYTYEMKIEDEFVFNIIHLAGHFRHGGAGLRFVMDIFVYDHWEMDREYLTRTLKELNLYDFYRNVSALAEHWFGEGEASPLLDRLGAYVLSGRIFGGAENAEALAVGKKGKLKFLLSACFPSYGEMVSMFPWLRGRRLLLPLAWLVRALRSLKYRRSNVRVQFDTFRKGNVKRGKDIQAFYKECGLS